MMPTSSVRPGPLSLFPVLAVLVALVALGACGGAPPPPPLEPLIVTIEEITDVGDHPLAAEESQLMSDRVATRRQGEHGALPAVEQQEGAASPDDWPLVGIRNDTPHGLVVWFSGPCPRTVALIPGTDQVTELCEGTYDIAAELAADDFLPFANEGDQLDNGFLYGLSFYVVVEPQTRGRRGRRGRMGGMRRR
ncbi:MAG: hypothetical protein JRH11_26105 [Deltaproteobacteria bacterium]|nr:hypothetical protein [Deltaproteobacteria bacterium]